MRLAHTIFLSVTLSALVLARPVLAVEKVALVIGNNAYSSMRPLENARSDARLIHRTLTAMGFDAGDEPLLDLDQSAFNRALRDFSRRTRGADTAVLYYAGHGMEIGGVNYLIPVGAEIEEDGDAPHEAVPLDRVLNAMRGAKRLGLVLLDACRNDPFGRSRAFRGSASPAFRGVTRPSALSRVAVGFAAQLNALASDGEDGNSPYARALAQHLPARGVEFDDVLARVGRAVEVATEGKQSPHLDARSALLAGYPLLPGPRSDEVAPPPPGSDSVFEAQGLLNRLGYDAGAMGPRMRRALQAFQRQNGLAPTGQADAATLRALRVAARYHGGGAQLAVGVPDPEREPPAAPPQRQQYRDLSRFRDCPDCPEMVVIPAGRFWMGSPEGEGYSNEGPQRRVTIGKFALSRTEVTFDQWQACVDDGFCRSNRKPRDEGWGRGSRPVINVSWNDINGERGFVAWMNSKVSGEPYRLPSEAEWEYAARGDQDGERNAPPYPWGHVASHKYANYGNDACCGGQVKGRDRWEFTAPAGSFPKNGFGLHDMHGNVWEWVQDCWHSSYEGAPVDGSAWMEAGGGDCSRGVLRGGGWNFTGIDLRSAERSWDRLIRRSGSYGFRLARTLPE